MRHLLCLPDPRLVSEKDCDSINAIMKRLKNKGIVEIESEPVFFKLNPAPENCRKYRIYMDSKECGNSELTRCEQELLLGECENEYEKNLIENCFYAYCENGVQLLKEFKCLEPSLDAWAKAA